MMCGEIEVKNMSLWRLKGVQQEVTYGEGRTPCG